MLGRLRGKRNETPTPKNNSSKQCEQIEHCVHLHTAALAHDVTLSLTTCKAYLTITHDNNG